MVYFPSGARRWEAPRQLKADAATKDIIIAVTAHAFSAERELARAGRRIPAEDTEALGADNNLLLRQAARR